MNIPVPFPLLWLGKKLTGFWSDLKVQSAPGRCSKRGLLVGEKAVTKDHGPLPRVRVAQGGPPWIWDSLRLQVWNPCCCLRVFDGWKPIFFVKPMGWNKQQVVEECGRSNIDHVNFLSGTLTVDRWPLTDLLRRDSSRFNARFSLERCRKGYSYRSG